MPLPEPKATEKTPAFVSRCMADPTMTKEYPDEKQRAAVCYSQAKKSAEPAETAVAIPLQKNARRQIVTGVVLRPDVEDSQGDILTREAIDRAATQYVIEYRKQCATTGDQHALELDAFIVETWICRHDDDVPGAREGDWLISMWIPSPEKWAAIEKADYTGFSIHGIGRRFARDQEDP